MIWYLSIKVLIDIDIISSFRLPGGFLARSAKIEEIMTSIDVVFAHFSQPDGFLAERLGDAMRVLGMNPTEEEDGHGCDFRGRLGWPLEFSSRKLASPVQCVGLPFLLLFRSAIRSASTWQILGAPVHWGKDVSPFHQGLRVWDWFHVWRSFTMFQVCFC